MITLARKLGTTEHLSPLMRKARKLGLASPGDLQALAVRRGCDYYRGSGAPSAAEVSPERFSDEELALALLHPSQPWDPQTLRLGAAMLGAAGNEPARLARLARMERSEPILRQIAEAGRRFEPGNPFWTELLALLSSSSLPADGVLPHPTRYVGMTGITRRGRETVSEWIRPHPARTPHG